MKISQQRLEENRQNLLDAAARLLREQGWGANMAEEKNTLVGR